MLNNFKHFLRSLNYKESDYIATDDDSLKLFWWNGQVNLGDVINLELVKTLSKKKVEWVPNNYSQEFNTCIGSVLQLANNHTTVWGSGYISEAARSPKKPKMVCAVRGPKTRQLLLAQGVECPEVYGDPALLAPMLFPINEMKKYELGIIPHFVDKKAAFFQQQFPDNIKIIDIETDDVNQFLSEVNQCEKIISSSLHGVILADAYGIPAHRVKFSNDISGGDFKFEDYYLSVKREIIKPVYIDKNTTIDSIMNMGFDYSIDIDTSQLLEACPFKG